MIQVLSLIKQHGHQRVRAAVEEALALGCSDAAAIRHLVEAVDLAHARSAIIELGALVALRTSTAGDHRLRWAARARRWRHECAGRRPGSGHASSSSARYYGCRRSRRNVRQLAEQAVRERRTHLGFLEALLQAELEEREQRLVERRIREAHLPRMKTLEEFDFARNPKVSAQQIHELAKAVTSPGPSRSSLSATAAPARPICSPAWRWPPAGRSAGSASPPPPR